jgi:microcystin-dependent protein
MTVSTTATRTTYTGDATTTAFAVPFVFFGADELQVVERVIATGGETVLTRGTHYTVSGGNGAIGTVTALSAPAATVQWTIRRVTARTQLVDYLTGDAFPAETHERALDRLVALIQEIEDSVLRSLRAPIGDAAIADMPASPARASRYLAFDASGQPIAASSTPGTAVVSTFGASLIDDLTAAAARTTLGLGALATAASVGTADITANAVTVAKLAREGTSGQVLTSNGAGADPSYQTIASAASVPTGAILDYAGLTAPAGYLLCDGAAVSRTTYATLWAAMNASATVTMTIASPGVVTWTGHALQNGDSIRLTTTGALPTGFGTGITYFVVSVATNTFQLSATRGGTAINTSGSQSGTHTAIWAPFGYGDNSTTFNVPDLRGRVAAGRDTMGGTAAGNLTLANGLSGPNLGAVGGTQVHTLTTNEMPNHTHAGTFVTTSGSSYQTPNPETPFLGSGGVSATGGGLAHNNTQPTAVTNKIIKT